MLALNSVAICGEIVDEATVMVNDKGQSTASGTVLISERGSTGQTFKIFCPVTAYGTQAERLAQARKGTTVGITGKLSWAKSRDGKGQLAVYVLQIESDEGDDRG